MTEIQQGSSATPSMLLEVSSKLSMIFWEIVYRANVKGYKVLITSIIRPKTTDSGIHSLARAIDFIFVTDNNNIIPYNDFYDSLIKDINTKYPYDPSRPAHVTLEWHQVPGFGGWHFHCQSLS